MTPNLDKILGLAGGLVEPAVLGPGDQDGDWDGDYEPSDSELDEASDYLAAQSPWVAQIMRGEFAGEPADEVPEK